MDSLRRCSWVNLKNPLSVDYHDKEWGVPVKEDRKWFEYLVLDAFQAGLSWEIVLNKRENYRLAFDNFDFEKIALYDENKIQSLLQNKGIIRNQLKIRASVTNAQSFLEMRREFDSFNHFIWDFIGGKPIVNAFQRLDELPANTSLSDRLSKFLKKRNFKFVGTTICYSFMQAGGLVNDHLVDCFRYKEV